MHGALCTSTIETNYGLQQSSRINGAASVALARPAAAATAAATVNKLAPA